MKSMKRTARLIVLTVLLTGLTTIAYAQPVIITETAAPRSRLLAGRHRRLILAVAFAHPTHLRRRRHHTGPDEPRGVVKNEEGEGETIYMRTAHRFSNAFGVWSSSRPLSGLCRDVAGRHPLGHRQRILRTVLGWPSGAFLSADNRSGSSRRDLLVGSLMHRRQRRVVRLQGCRRSLHKSPEDCIADAARDVTASVRQELFGDIDAETAAQDDSYVQQIKPMDAKTIRKKYRSLTTSKPCPSSTVKARSPISLRSVRLEAGGKMSREKANHSRASLTP